MGDRIRASVVHRLALLLVGGVAAAAAAAAPGDFDTSFNRQGNVPGTVTTNFGSATDDQANAVALQPDGKIVAAGAATVGGKGTQNVFALARYKNDGSLDPYFNVSGAVPGTVTTAFEGGAQANALVVQSDGKLVAAGTANVTVNGTARNVFAVVRYQTDGTLDPCLNPDPSPCSNRSKGGTVTTAFPGDAEANALALQSDGKLVVAGTADDSGNSHIALVRYNADGSLDKNGFNAGGTTPGTLVDKNLDGDAYATAVVIQRDGKILVAGYRSLNGTDDFVLVRYKADGTLDTTFNPGGPTQGILVKDLGGNDQAYALLTQFDDKIVVAGRTKQGTADSNFFLARYDITGSLDTSFGQGGIVTTSFGGNAEAHGLVQQPDGMLVAAGFVNPGAAGEMALARYTGTGALDSSFGNAGTLVSSGNDLAYALALDPKAKIVVAGAKDGGVSNKDFLLARYSAADTAWQLEPARFSLDNVTEVEPGTFKPSSQTAPIQGLGSGLMVPVLVRNGKVSKGNATTYDNVASWAQNGDQFSVGHTAAAQQGRSTTTTLSIGGLAAPNNMMVAVGPVVSATFTSTSARSPQITASHFSTEQTTQATTYYSLVPRATDQNGYSAECGGAQGNLVFSITNKPSWAHFDYACGKLEGFPGSGDAGTKTTGIVISVKDKQTGLKASLPAFSLTVTNNADGSGPVGPVSLAVMAWAGWRRRRARY